MRLGTIILGLSLLLMAPSVSGQKVTTNEARNVSWSQYRTYAWGAGTPARDLVVAERIVAAIDAQLSAKGFKRVDSDSDLLVLYHVGSDQQESLNWNNFRGWGRFAGMGLAQVDRVAIGQLKVDIADVKFKQFLWRGTATDSVSQDPQKDKLDKAVAKMFRKLSR